MKPIRFLLFCLAFLLPAFSVVHAQMDTGGLKGTITDPSGAAVVGASVHIHNPSTGLDRTTQSSGNGTYQFTDLQPGPYQIEILATGFGKYSMTRAVTVGGSTTVDAKLSVTATTQVEVDASQDVGAQVNTNDQQISQVITPKQVMDLPSLSRDPYDFVALSGNVTSDPNGSTGPNGVGVSFSGLRSASTEILLDGAENVDLYDAAVGQQIPLDSVDEYRTITDGFTAEYGRASGGVVNLVTKSGTNKFHGSLYEYNRLSALAANTYNEDAQNVYLRSLGESPLPADHFTRNQFGYSVGGPVPFFAHKVFFFSNTEWNRIRSTGLQQFIVPTSSFIASSASNTQQFFSNYGTLASGTTLGQTVAVSGFATNPLQIANVQAPIDAGAGAPVNAWDTDARFDVNLSEKTTMFFRAAVYSDDYTAGFVSLSPYNGYNTGQTDLNQSFLYSLTHVFSPNLVSVSKVSYNRFNESEPLGSAGVTPTLYLSHNNTASVDTTTGTDIAMPGYLPTSPGNALPFGGPQNLYQFGEDISWTVKAHTFHFGGGFLQLRDNRTFGAYETALELAAKNGTDEGTALGQLQAGNLYQFEVAIDPQGKYPCSLNPTTGALTETTACTLTTPLSAPSFTRENTFNDGNWYAQDSWKATPRLTLNYGIRWEYYGVQHNTNPNLESNFYLGPGDNFFEQIRNGQVATTPNSPTGGLIEKRLKNYAPRIGFAYDIKGDGKWALRGGYGISYERDFGNVTYNVIQNPPNYAGVLLTTNQLGQGQLSVTSDNLGPFAGSGGSVPFAPSSLRALQQNMPTAYAHQWDLALEHEVAPGTLLGIEYTGTRGVHAYAIANVNSAYYGNAFLGDALNAAGTGNPINYQYGAINIREANGDSYYNALNIRFEDNNYTRYGLQVTANYTYAHAMDNLSSTFSQSGNNFNLGYLNPFKPALDRGNSDYDIRQRLTIGGIYEPSFLEFRGNRILHATLGGLEFAPIATLRSGNAFTIFDCTNGYAACPRIVDAPGLKFHGTPQATGAPNGYNYITLPTASANPFVNAYGFSDFPSCATCGQNPGLGRNQWFGPNNYQFDMGVYKNFHLGKSDRYTAQLRGEFYDILNHHNFYPVVGNADYAETSVISALKGTPNGSPSSEDERRNVQIALRFEF
ncbi:TonB-dependent receptor [Silvibacterium dinghuense]|nr:carboxypeptidase-like regulatory domain-containing protein [Silvibacterium dinghuense]